MIKPIQTKKEMAPKENLAKTVEKQLSKLNSPLKVLSAVEVPTSNGSCLLVFIPYKQLSTYKKTASELQSKLSQTTIFIAQRTVLGKNHTRYPGVKAGTPRPNSRTLSSVQDNMLNDLCYPTEVVGKRIRYNKDGTKIVKIFLDPTVKEEVEDKLEAFEAVYSKLTNKKAIFSFPVEV
eukprot:maker-scaffold_46-snap-gene-1.98-mRNA-1 protein AED:0.18 eAED:0.19 QI:0/0/0/1/0/0/2/0/177